MPFFAKIKNGHKKNHIKCLPLPAEFSADEKKKKEKKGTGFLNSPAHSALFH